MKRLAIAMTIVAASAGLAACGQEDEPLTLGETEGIYVTAGEVKYQVQISRVLNPFDAEDSAYVAGITNPLERDLPNDREWFGVFLRAENDTDEPQQTTGDIKILDTTGAEFEPVAQDPAANPLVYGSVVLEPDELLPDPDSVTRAGPTQGALVLFQIPRENLENRPLELEIITPENTALVDLDI